MNIKILLEEYNLEIDDVRWFLSLREADHLIEISKDRDELAKILWSGELEERLYNREEALITELEEQFERGITDESHIRELFAEMEVASIKRRRNR